MKIQSAISNARTLTQVAALSLMVTAAPLAANTLNNDKFESSKMTEFLGMGDENKKKKPVPFKFNISDFADKAKKVGVNLTYYDKKSGVSSSVSSLKKIPKQLAAELRDALKPYDDNKNNSFDTPEMKMFLNEAKNLTDKHPSGIALSRHITASQGKQICTVDEVFKAPVATKAISDNKLARAKKPKYLGAKDSTIYVYQPMKYTQGDFWRNKTYKESETKGLLNIFKKNQKITLKDPDKLIVKALAKKSGKKKDELELKVLRKLLHLKPGQKRVFVFNEMPDGTKVRGNLKRSYVHSYTVERKNFNRMIVTEGIVDTVENESKGILKKLFKKIKK